MSNTLLEEREQPNYHQQLQPTPYFASSKNTTTTTTASINTTTTTSSNATITIRNNNNKDTNIPHWLHTYFQWHYQVRHNLTVQTYRQYKYIVMTCLKGQKCGGMTDRLRPVLAQLQLAHQTQRLLFIYWERPFPLEEFLLPPTGTGTGTGTSGCYDFDWRLPSFLIPEVRASRITGHLGMKPYQSEQNWLITTMYQSWHYGELLYNERKESEQEDDAMTVFRHVWNHIFTPSPAVLKQIYKSYDSMGIRPGQYSTAHVRALYAREDREVHEITNLVHNALNCLSQLAPDPYMIVSDSNKAVEIAKSYGRYRNVTIVSPPSSDDIYDNSNTQATPPLHIGLHNESDPNIGPADFINVFSDMYLIAETRCMVVGAGGFGRWGILLGHDPQCHVVSTGGFKGQHCQNWKTWNGNEEEDTSTASSGEMNSKQISSSPTRTIAEIPVFRPPMPHRKH